MSEKLCKAFKNMDFKDYTKLVKDSKYVCKKCGRTAKNEENLCEAKKIKSKED